MAEKERHARAGADAQLAAQRRQQLGPAAGGVGAPTKLGLEHRRQPLQGLEEYVRERYGPDDGERPDETPPDTDVRE